MGCTRRALAPSEIRLAHRVSLHLLHLKWTEGFLRYIKVTLFTCSCTKVTLFTCSCTKVTLFTCSCTKVTLVTCSCTKVTLFTCSCTKVALFTKSHYLPVVVAEPTAAWFLSLFQKRAEWLGPDFEHQRHSPGNQKQKILISRDEISWCLVYISKQCWYRFLRYLLPAKTIKLFYPVFRMAHILVSLDASHMPKIELLTHNGHFLHVQLVETASAPIVCTKQTRPCKHLIEREISLTFLPNLKSLNSWCQGQQGCQGQKGCQGQQNCDTPMRAFSAYYLLIKSGYLHVTLCLDFFHSTDF